MEINNKKIGIIINSNYFPSTEAGKYIKGILDRINISNEYLSMEDLMQNNIRCDLIFNVYYGEFGDGGFIASLLEEKKIKFVGNKQHTCVLMWNKVLSKMIFEQQGFFTPKYWYSFNGIYNAENLYKLIIKKLTFPIIVKPTCGAASEGIVLLDEPKNLREFIGSHFDYINNGYYFFEEFIEGVEISAGYIRAIDKKLPIAEILVHKHRFQDNKVKFSPGLKENIIPARLPNHITNDVHDIVKKLSKAFNVNYFCRTDMIYNNKDNKVYILETNTNPGLLSTSLLPMIVKYAGITEIDLFKIFIKYHTNFLLDRNFKSSDEKM